jgi:hypothetical protein
LLTCGYDVRKEVGDDRRLGGWTTNKLEEEEEEQTCACLKPGITWKKMMHLVMKQKK